MLDTLESRSPVPISKWTGELRRPIPIWTATVCSWLAVACFAISLGAIYLRAIFTFSEASWLMAQFETIPGALERVLLTVAVTVIMLVPAITSAIAGFYAWTGYRWTRIAGLIALVLTSTAAAVTVIGYPADAITLAAVVFSLIAVISLWLPPATRFFVAWHARRHPIPQYAPPVTQVNYGPLPRYR